MKKEPREVLKQKLTQKLNEKLAAEYKLYREELDSKLFNDIDEWRCLDEKLNPDLNEEIELKAKEVTMSDDVFTLGQVSINIHTLFKDMVEPYIRAFDKRDTETMTVYEALAIAIDDYHAVESEAWWESEDDCEWKLPKYITSELSVIWQLIRVVRHHDTEFPEELHGHPIYLWDMNVEKLKKYAEIEMVSLNRAVRHGAQEYIKKADCWKTILEIILDVLYSDVLDCD